MNGYDLIKFILIDKQIDSLEIRGKILNRISDTVKVISSKIEKNN